MKEIDDFLKEWVTPLLKGAGFHKSGHTYRLAHDTGDWTGVHFASFPIGTLGSFSVAVAFAPAALVDLNAFRFHEPVRPPLVSSLDWARSLVPPEGQGLGLVLWEYDERAARTRCGQALQEELGRAIGVLSGLTDADARYDMAFGPVRPLHPADGYHGPWWRLALLAERGASDELREQATSMRRFLPHLDEWVADRVDRRSSPDLDAPGPRPLADYDDLRTGLSDALDQWVTPALTAPDWDRTDVGYRRRSGRGDEAFIEVTLSATSTGDRLTFFVTSGVRIASDAAYIASDPLDSFGDPRPVMPWAYGDVPPPAAHQSPHPALTALGLRAWSASPDAQPETFGALVTALVDEAELLGGLLDRPRLRAFLHGPDAAERESPYPLEVLDLLLLIDDGVSPELTTTLNYVDLYEGPDAREARQILHWALARLGEPVAD